MQLIAVFLISAALMSAHAGTFFVSDSLDTTNATSLRGAIIAANRGGGANIIVLTNAVCDLTITGIDEIGSFTGDLDVTNGSMTIIGLSWPSVVIDASHLGDRVFQVLPNAQLTLDNVVITGGAAPGDFYISGYRGVDDAEPGGAIYNMGTVTLEDCTLSNNISGGGDYSNGDFGGTSGADGGGIYNSGLLTMASSTVIDNSTGPGADGGSGGNGGGIFNSGTCILSGCLINGNSSGPGGPPEGNFWGIGGDGGCGGGIYNSGTLTLDNCILSSNIAGLGATGGEGGTGGFFSITAPLPGGSGGAGGNGGGLYNTGRVWMAKCTLSGNSGGNGGGGGPGINAVGGNPGTGGSGAGIDNKGDLSLNTCTIGGNQCGNGGSGGSGNLASGAAGASGGGGGGIRNNGTLNLIACSIALNTTGSGGNGGKAYDVYWPPPWETYVPSPGASGGSGGPGGGILNTTSNNVFIINTLIASNITGIGGAGGTNASGVIGNSGAVGSGSDGEGHLLSQGFNLIGEIDGIAGLTNGVNGDITGNHAHPVNPRLSPLQDNGGNTPTFAILPGSPAIDTGNDRLLKAPENLSVDQRGSPRKSGAHIDIGAYEYDGMIAGIVLPPQLTAPNVGSGGLEFWFNGAPGLNYSVWASTNLSAWINVGTAVESSTGWFNFKDPTATNYDRRFYQIRYP